jgi:hypothetical protein
MQGGEWIQSGGSITRMAVTVDTGTGIRSARGVRVARLRRDTLVGATAGRRSTFDLKVRGFTTRTSQSN